MVPAWMAGFVQQVGVYLVLVGLGGLYVRAAKAKGTNANGQGGGEGLLHAFVFGQEAPEAEDEAQGGAGTAGAAARDGDANKGASQVVLQFVFCASGLLGAYLAWGVLQEKLVSHEYATGRLESATFLVFCNRAVALAVSGIIVSTQPGHGPIRAPLYLFSLVSLSNVVSSFCQIESLKFVSFPTQVLAKSGKLIPVMIVGRLMSGKGYEPYQYAVAVAICVGVAVFMLGQSSQNAPNSPSSPNSEPYEATSWAGVFLLGMYLFFDSFTSQFQSSLFASYKLSSYQMMLGVNGFSASFTLVSLLQSGELLESLAFCLRNPPCALHVALFSLAGVVGQSFIFHTIRHLGPLVFTMIMNSRQVCSIVLSCVLFGHHISAQGVFGAAIVFAAIGYDVYRKATKTKPKPKTKTKTN